jgi:hypothetical protein
VMLVRLSRDALVTAVLVGPAPHTKWQWLNF